MFAEAAKTENARLRIMFAPLALLGLVAAVFAVERTARFDDAAQYRVMAGRLVRTGDPFYVAAVDHKGPLWAQLYRAAYVISSEQRWFWFVIASIMVGFAALTAWALRELLVRTTGSTAANLVATITGAFLVFGPEPYSKILYGRNITVAMTTLAVLCVSKAIGSSLTKEGALLVMAGVLLGLASTTVLTTVAPTALLACALGVSDTSLRRGAGRAVALVVSAVAAFAATPIWYWSRGVGEDFRTYFWDFNRAYADVDVGTAARLGRAATELGLYHYRHPYLILGPVAAAVVLLRLRPVPAQRRSSTFPAVLLLAWWVGEAISVVAPGRFFGHYWIALLVPSAALAGIAFSPVIARLRAGAADGALRSLRGAVPATLILVPMLLVGVLSLPRFFEGVSAAVSFDGARMHQADRDAARSASLAALRGVVEQLSSSEDEILVWSRVAAPYVILDRPAATRFDRRTWLTGEVYASDTLVVLPGVWEDAIRDLERSDPPLVVEFLDVPIPSGSVLELWVSSNYHTVYESVEPRPIRVWARAGNNLPYELAFADADGATDCWQTDGPADGSVVLVGSEQVGLLEVSTDGGVARRGATTPLGASLKDPRTASPAPGQRLRLTTTNTSGALWAGDQVLAAMHLPHGIESVHFTGDLAQLSSC